MKERSSKNHNRTKSKDRNQSHDPIYPDSSKWNPNQSRKQTDDYYNFKQGKKQFYPDVKPRAAPRVEKKY